VRRDSPDRVEQVFGSLISSRGSDSSQRSRLDLDAGCPEYLKPLVLGVRRVADEAEHLCTRPTRTRESSINHIEVGGTGEHLGELLRKPGQEAR